MVSAGQKCTRLAVRTDLCTCMQVAPLPSTLATVPTSLTATNINKQLAGSRRFSRTRSHKEDDAASQGSGHSSASRYSLIASQCHLTAVRATNLLATYIQETCKVNDVENVKATCGCYAHYTMHCSIWLSKSVLQLLATHLLRQACDSTLLHA